ncbi:hypothetical protein [Blastochloris sulfoviridis]|uniref:Uncharacterized protein n=1 Tax=Blastochloris sulfoviridis TaxID=50712 RepID=A0A5M6HXG9_9HYPH|nr:hypothetical protein [Blastochloris sulfoviridis]KAA5600367.1 hypothetical protein F1193_10730 [Blastochloris sulfoviridis]
MRADIAALCGALAILLAGSAAAQPPADAWVTYRNPRFGTTAEVPRHLVPRQMPDPTNGDGRTWTSADGRATVTVFGAFNALDLTPERYVEDIHADRLPHASYRRIADTWFVISGTKDGVVFYDRCNFTGDLRVQHCIALSYPEGDAPAWDAAVARISKSLRIGRGLDG